MNHQINSIIQQTINQLQTTLSTAIRETACNENQPDFAISRAEAAKICNVKPHTIDYHCKMGRLRRMKIGNASRASGISALSVAKATNTPIWNIIEVINKSRKSDNYKIAV